MTVSEEIITATAPGERPGLFLLERATAGTTMAECEAERRNRQALHAMEVDWGKGLFDYGKIRAILAGSRVEQCLDEHWVTEVRPGSVA